MSNSRAVNRRADLYFRSIKRSRTGTNTYHDRIVESDDFEVVYTREEGLNGRKHHVETPRSPQRGRTSWVTGGNTWAPQDSPELGLDPVGDWCDEEYDKEVTDEPRPHAKPTKPKKKSRVSVRSILVFLSTAIKFNQTPQKRPHVVWKELHRQTYLDEMMRLEGRGDFRTSTACPDCMLHGRDVVGAPVYRCRDCFMPDLVCQSCCVSRHRFHPFHHVERWTGSYFVRTPLKDAGLRIQLNHASMRCSAPKPAHSSLRVLHTNGIHDVAIDYCGCERATPHHIQLLRRGLYPASQINPKTCASFQLLNLLHLLALTSKGSTYDFYRMLEKATNNTGVYLPKSRYRMLLRMVLQWRHLKLLKRGGRGNDPTGAAGTKEGELAILCPSCPHPGINLPQDWERVAECLRFLYILILCIDANFRLKNQLVSSYSQDPGLGIGMAYMVALEPYDRYVLSRAKDADVCPILFAL